MKVQDKEDTPQVHVSDDNGQNKTEIYRRAEYIIPQLDGTHDASDSSNIDLHDYLDLANMDIIQHNTRGQKKRQKAAEAEIANIHSAGIEIIKPNTRGRKQRQMHDPGSRICAIFVLYTVPIVPSFTSRV